MREVRAVHLETRIIQSLQDRSMLLPKGGGASIPIEGHWAGILIPATVNRNLCQWSLRHQLSVDNREGKEHMILKWIGRFSSQS